MKLNKHKESDLLKVYNTYWNSYVEGTPEKMIPILVDDYNQVGSAEAEVFFNKKDAAKFILDTIDQIAGKTEIRNRFIKVDPLGDSVLVTDLFDIYALIDGNWAFYSKFRSSTLMKETNEGWKFIHQHSSMPDNRTDEGENIAIEKIAEENSALREAVKRRTIELEQKHRELEIEASLEKVRSRTMAMQHSDGLGDVATVLFKELNLLVENLWTCGFVLCEKNRSEDEWWLSTKEGFIPAFYLPNTVDVTHENIYKAWESGETYHTEQLEGKALQEHYDWLMNIPASKKIFEEMAANGLSLPTWQKLHCAYFSYGYLVMITQVPCPEEAIFKRFAQVFDQTYTRFLDLQKAEAQAREAQIEAALERVRSRSMAMHKSEELKEVIQVVYEQFAQLNIVIEHTGFIMDYQTRDDMHIWLADKLGVPSQVTIPYFDSPHWNSFNEAKESGTEFFANNLTFEEKNRFYKELFRYIPGLSEESKEFYFNCPGLAISTVLLENVGLYIENFSGTPYTDEENNTLMRFGKVFQQTYTRFLDLQKVETRSREAQIEAALEKVRSRSIGMQKSEELREVIQVIHDQLIQLNFEIDAVGFTLDYHQNNDWNTWIANKSASLPSLMFIPYIDHPQFNYYKSAKEEGLEFLANTLSFEEKNSIFNYMFGFMGNYPQAEKDEVLRKPGLAISQAFLKNISLWIYNLEAIPYSKEDNNTLMRFAKVFQQTYTRFLDLQKAEKQAREAQIEAALEKVRSRSLAMHIANELGDVVTVIVEKLKDLDVVLDANGVVLCTYFKDSKDVMHWMASPDFSFAGSYLLPYFDHPIFNDAWQSKESGAEYFSKAYSVEEKNSFFEYAFEHSDYKQFPDDFKHWIFQNDQHILSFAWQKNSAILIPSHTGVLPSEEDIAILKRFAKVFEQSYVRFLDLQKAESQAREAKIETALERVRARALAMHEPEELMKVADVLRNEMGMLGVEELETCSIYIKDESAQEAECWYAIKDIREEEKILVNDNFILNLNETWVGREMLKYYTSDKKQVSIIMTGEPRIEWIRYCENKSAPLRGYYGEIIPDRTYHLYKFTHGAIGMATAGDISEENWSLLKRAAAVFSLAYSRFKDLTQARIDLIRLKEEKNRAETALSNLEATQSQLVHAEKMASLGELTAGIAHEIQNPLNFVKNFSEVNAELIEELREEINNGDLEEAKALVNDIAENEVKIVHHGKRADSIVKGMLQHSRITTGEKEPTDLNALAEEYLRLAYHGLKAKDNSFNVDFKTDLDKNIPNIKVVPQDIGRVLLNLVNNAFHACAERSRSTVAEKSKNQDQGYKPLVTIITKKEADKIIIKVVDNGNGIPSHVKDKIFQPFFTTKPTGEGTGLGLSLSYDIITKGHGGQLKVETKEGEGSEFIIHLFDKI